MVKLTKLYTKTGDDGTTGLVGGTRVPKNSLRVAAYGDIDELNALIGWARTEAERISLPLITDELTQLQNTLFNIGSELATDPDQKYEGMIVCTTEQITQIEERIDAHTAQVKELRSFVLPGGTELNSRLHIARTVCRRAERTLMSLAAEESVTKEVITYVNRLSDYLFALARIATHSEDGQEYLWAPGEETPKKKED